MVAEDNIAVAKIVFLKYRMLCLHGQMIKGKLVKNVIVLHNGL